MHDDAVDGALKRIHQSLDRVEQLADGGNRNTAKIEVNAGGVGVWIAATCCLVVMAVTVVGSVYITREFTRQDVQMQELRDKDSVHDAWLQTLNNNKEDKKR
jgi:heme exporter protein D